MHTSIAEKALSIWIRQGLFLLGMPWTQRNSVPLSPAVCPIFLWALCRGGKCFAQPLYTGKGKTLRASLCQSQSRKVHGLGGCPFPPLQNVFTEASVGSSPFESHVFWKLELLLSACNKFLMHSTGWQVCKYRFVSKVHVPVVKYVSMACGENETVLVTSTIGAALRAGVEPLSCSWGSASLHDTGDCC